MPRSPRPAATPSATPSTTPSTTPSVSRPKRRQPATAQAEAVDGMADGTVDGQGDGQGDRPGDGADASAKVGTRLRYLRELHGLSQRELARRSGLTHATIGAIERDAISPSIGSMLKLVESFPITMSEFFALETSSTTQVFFRGDEMPESGSRGISVRQVGRDLKGKPLQVLIERYAPGTETAKAPYSHAGDEGGLVIQGRLEVTVGGSKRVLGPGDGYLFSSRLPHKFRNVGDEEAVVISANTPPL